MAGWLVTFALAQDWQSFTHSVTFFFMQGHTTLSVINLLVACTLGCTMPWKASNTRHQEDDWAQVAAAGITQHPDRAAAASLIVMFAGIIIESV